jgi:hypothetical protein
MFIVMTQTLENYGAHSEDGKFSSGNAYWKFKGGDTYLVEETMTVAEWEQTLPDDAGEMQSSRDYYLSQVKRVSPNTQKTKQGVTEMELMLI